MTRRTQSKYHALYQNLKQQIQDGERHPGEKLPSKRVLADTAGVSLITVEKAYAMLADEGYITPKQRQGYFVAAISPLPTKQRDHAPIHHLPEPPPPKKSAFGYSVWFKTVRRVMAEQGAALFVRSPREGCAVLRNAIADYLLRYRGMRADPERIIIGSGAEQLYEFAARVLGQVRCIGIEEPGYPTIKTVYDFLGVKTLPLAMGEDGIAKSELQKPFDVLHITPFHSFPTGISTSVAKRCEYLNWAHRTGNFLIEDDYASEFFKPGHPIEPLYAMDGTDSVIYINTFSKSLSPAMRMGYMILPKRLLAAYQKIGTGLSCSVPVMDQYVLAAFIQSGAFERHLNHLRCRLQ